MKIAYLINSLEIGGAELHTLELCRAMVKLGYEVFLIAPEGTLRKDFEDTGTRVIIDNPVKDIDYAFINRFKTLLVNEKMDIVHCHELKAVVNGLIAAKLAKVPQRIAHIHSPLPKWHIPIYKKIPDIIANAVVVNLCATDVIALNNSSRKLRIFGEFIRPSLIRVIPNGLDLNYLVFKNNHQKEDNHKIICKKYGLPVHSKLIGTLSRLTVEKGIDIAIDGFGSLKKANPGLFDESRLLIGGNGILKEALIDKVGNNHLGDRVIFLGFIAEEDKVTFLQGLDLFLFPTHHEGFGYVLIEAMAAGTPTLSSDIPVLKELTENGLYGQHFTVNNSQSLAQNLEKCLQAGPSEVKIKDAQNMVCERYSLGKFIKNYDRLYQKKYK